MPTLVLRFEPGLRADGGLFLPPDVEFGEGDSTPVNERPRAKARSRSSPARVNPEIVAKLNVTRRFGVKLREELISGPEAERFLAHEFFHAFHWILRPEEPTWLKEGLARNFEARAMKTRLSIEAERGFDPVGFGLIADFDPRTASPAQLGRNELYFRYLIRRCGGEELFWNLVEWGSGAQGIRTIETALRRKPVARIGCASFRESFIEFEIARAVNARKKGASDPERWFLADASEKKSPGARDLPTEAEWSALGEWTATLVDWKEVRARTSVTGLPAHLRDHAWWIRDSNLPEVKHARDPGAKGAKQVLLLKLPTAALPATGRSPEPGSNSRGG